MRSTALLGRVVGTEELTVAGSLRTRFIGVPARLVNCSGHLTLRMPENWLWAEGFIRSLRRLRALPTYTLG
jgi:hypothetical protein